MLEKEKLLKQERVDKAIDKNYMGLDGKFGIILKCFGKPVITQGSANYEVTDFKDMYELQDEDTILQEDPDAPIREVGKIFDGLKFGYNIEITYLKTGTVPIKVDEYYTKYMESDRVLKVIWKGYIVYLEVEGDLQVFTPNAEWEDVVQKVYDAAEKVSKKHKMETADIMQEESKKAKMSFLQRLREKWGI